MANGEIENARPIYNKIDENGNLMKQVFKYNNGGWSIPGLATMSKFLRFCLYDILCMHSKFNE